MKYNVVLQVEREVIKLMEKALDLCRLEMSQRDNITYIYRAATIHHRLASLYHSAYRNQVWCGSVLTWRLGDGGPYVIEYIEP